MPFLPSRVIGPRRWETRHYYAHIHYCGGRFYSCIPSNGNRWAFDVSWSDTPPARQTVNRKAGK